MTIISQSTSAHGISVCYYKNENKDDESVNIYGTSDTISPKRNIPLADEGERDGVWGWNDVGKFNRNLSSRSTSDVYRRPCLSL